MTSRLLLLFSSTLSVITLKLINSITHSTGKDMVNILIVIIKLMNEKALRKHNKHGKIAASVFRSCSSVVMTYFTPLTTPSA